MTTLTFDGSGYADAPAANDPAHTDTDAFTGSREVLTPDIAIIGGGSGGLSTAAAAAAFGVDVVLIEAGEMGGDCLNYGCVPSKAVIAAAKHAHAARQGAKYGVNVEGITVDYARVHQHVEEVIASIAPNDSEERFTGLGVHVIRARGRFTDPRTVVAGGYEIKARRFVVATGSHAFVPPIEGLDSVDYLTNETLFDLTELPGHLIVIGGGPIGMEMAQAHRRLGSDVTVLEGAKALGKDDPELAEIVLDKVRGEGVDIREHSKVVRVAPGAGGRIAVTIERDGEEETIEGTHLLVAAGRAATVDGLGLDEAGIEYDRRGIKVDDGMVSRTNRKVYAIGDVAGGFQFTHWAGYHAGLVIRSALFRIPAKENRDIVPWATYTDPELGHVGLTEDQARERFGKINVHRWPYAENDRAQAERKTAGLIKVLATGKGRIVGASVAGAGAGEIINTMSLAVAKKMKLADMTAFVSPYPTLTEIGKRAATSALAPKAKLPAVRKAVKLLQKLG